MKLKISETEFDLPEEIAHLEPILRHSIVVREGWRDSWECGIEGVVRPESTVEFSKETEFQDWQAGLSRKIADSALEAFKRKEPVIFYDDTFYGRGEVVCSEDGKFYVNQSEGFDAIDERLYANALNFAIAVESELAKEPKVVKERSLFIEPSSYGITVTWRFDTFSMLFLPDSKSFGASWEVGWVGKVGTDIDGELDGIGGTVRTRSPSPKELSDLIRKFAS